MEDVTLDAMKIERFSRALSSKGVWRGGILVSALMALLGCQADSANKGATSVPL